jgi:hypothetical protein
MAYCVVVNNYRKVMNPDEIYIPHCEDYPLRGSKYRQSGNWAVIIYLSYLFSLL